MLIIFLSLADPGFSQGAPAVGGWGAPGYDFINFPKLHEIEKNLVAGGARSATTYHTTLLNDVV